MRTLLWLGLGAAAMYLFDPEQGRRRRAMLRDKADQYRQRARKAPAENPPFEPDRPTDTPEGAHHLGR